MVPTNKNLYKGDWCPVRQSMASGNEPNARDLCVHTAHVRQDSCSALTALGIIELSALWEGQQTLNLVFHHCENFDHLNTLKR